MTEEEIHAAIYEAKKKKAAKINESKYWESIKKPIEKLQLTAEQLQEQAIKTALAKNPKFKNDEHFSKVLWSLSLYFANDTRFEALNEFFSLRKGVALFGNIGCGKTTILNLFTENPKMSFSVIPCKNIAEDFQRSGIDSIASFKSLKVQSLRVDPFGHKEFGTVFDDLGTEETKKNFGNSVNVMSSIILDRYNNQDTWTGTHFTTNLNGQEIEEFYGSRVKSRISEMFNIIKFSSEAPDRRQTF